MLPVPPIIAAAQAGRTDRVVELLDTGCGSALDVDASGQTALHKAALLGLFNMAQVLIAREPDVVSACDAGHNTPLHLAAWGRQVRVVAQLLEAQAAVSSADLCGNTPLHRAALVAHVGVGELLLHHRADVDAVGSAGSTPLHFCALSRSDDAETDDADPAGFARMLLGHGADASLANRHGTLARELAHEQGNDAVVSILEQLADASPSHAARDTRTRTEGPSAQTGPSDGGAEGPGTFMLPKRRGGSTREVLGVVVDALQSAPFRRMLSRFHASHRHKFVRFAGGDYPVELSSLHQQFAGLLSQHVEVALRRAGHSWEAACEACAALAVEGGCSALRLRLLEQLAAIDHFESFYELMRRDELPAAGAQPSEGTQQQGAQQRGVHGGGCDELLDEEPRHSRDASLAATVDSDLSQPSVPPGAFADSRLARTLPSVHAESLGGRGDADGGGAEGGSSHDGGASTCSSASGWSWSSAAMAAPMGPTILDGALRLADGSKVHGQWVRGKRIGVGSSGEVYLVRDEARGIEFAAKLVIPRDEEAAARLETEITLMRKLRHPHIVEYIGAALCHSERYILLELCQGGSVRQLLDREHSDGLPHATLHLYGTQLLSGVTFLHEHMIIHRDLKCDNLLLAHGATHVKLGDFGSSHELPVEGTMSHDVSAIRGSPYWMSPEHIQGARCGRKADIWSYACVLLEMLTGTPPWHARSGEPTTVGHFAVFQLLNRIVSSPGPPPMPPAEEMPGHLYPLLLDCFSRDLERRPTAAALLEYQWVAGGG